MDPVRPETGAVTARPATPLPSSNELADERTRLALSRTLAAMDRTLLAWVRTATSMISFGFTIYKFFQTMRSETANQDVRYLMTPRGVALVLIALGIGSLIVATLEYRGELGQLQREYVRYMPFRRSIAATVALIMCGLGVLGFVLVVLRQ
jgi:putative membrane protein